MAPSWPMRRRSGYDFLWAPADATDSPPPEPVTLPRDGRLRQMNRLVQGPGDFEVEGSDGTQAAHAAHHAHRQVHPYPEESFDMDEFAVAVVSYGTTILFATLGAALAMRLFRELLRPVRSTPEVLQMDIPGVAPFQPFAGQGYHLQADLKPPDKPGDTSASAPEVASQKPTEEGRASAEGISQ